MSLTEKLQMMEALWNDIAQQPEDVTVPQWHKELLDHRDGMVREGKAQFVDWATAKKQIRDTTR